MSLAPPNDPQEGQAINVERIIEGRKPKTFLSRAIRFARRTAAIIIWLYVITKLFIFDVDQFVVSKFAPGLSWILSYKFFLIIGFVGVISALFRKWQVISFIGYVIFYPFILLMLIVPYAIIKSRSWVFAIALVNSVIRFFANFRTNAILSAGFTMSALGISIGSGPVISASVVLMIATLLASYGLAIAAVFKGDAAFRAYRRIFSFLQTHTIKIYGLGEGVSLIPISELSEQQREKRKTNLEIAVVCNRFFLFSASRLKMYASQKFTWVAVVVKCLWLAVVCILAFAFINSGIAKLDITQFHPSVEPSSWLMIYYSFKQLILNSVPDLVPVGPWAKAASVFENAMGLFTTAIVFGSLLAQRTEHQYAEIKAAAESIEKDAQALEEFVRSEFRMTTIDEAIAEMERVKAGLVGLALWLSRSGGE